MFALRNSFSASKRLYKFILKRLIGKFLADDLDFDQLDVKPMSGEVQLSDLALNVDLLNEALHSGSSGVP